MARINNVKWDTISQKDFEEYSRAQNNEAQIAKFCHVSINTLDKWCHKTYGVGFKKANAEFMAEGVASMKKKLFQKGIKGNTACMIFYCKNFAGMSDNPQRTNPSVELANNTFSALQQAAQDRMLAKGETVKKNLKSKKKVSK